MAILQVNGDDGSNSYDARFHPALSNDLPVQMLNAAGTVQKKSARAKQFLLTQHEQTFCAALARVASASATKSSIGENKIRRRKDFCLASCGLSIVRDTARGV